jgi:pimeloyl-ACP methyl ester carboxylesterase
MWLCAAKKLSWSGRATTSQGSDFGGRGRDVLLVHGSGHNSAAWIAVAAHLLEHCHLVAIDMRGHGQTTLDSTNAEQYWRDLGPICEQLSLAHPVVVGHSTGGYAVTAATAAGILDAPASASSMASCSMPAMRQPPGWTAPQS